MRHAARNRAHRGRLPECCVRRVEDCVTIDPMNTPRYLTPLEYERLNNRLRRFWLRASVLLGLSALGLAIGYGAATLF